MKQKQYGGILSFLAFAASAFFFILIVFGVSLHSVRLLAAGLFALAAGNVLQRIGW